jgi:hypothetical protein
MPMLWGCFLWRKINTTKDKKMTTLAPIQKNLGSLNIERESLASDFDAAKTNLPVAKTFIANREVKDDSKKSIDDVRADNSRDNMKCVILSKDNKKIGRKVRVEGGYQIPIPRKFSIEYTVNASYYGKKVNVPVKIQAVVGLDSMSYYDINRNPQLPLMPIITISEYGRTASNKSDLGSASVKITPINDSVKIYTICDFRSIGGKVVRLENSDIRFLFKGDENPNAPHGD